MKIYLTDELDKRFRKAAMNAYGYGRGSLSKAAEEAFMEWCRKHEGVLEPTREQTNVIEETSGKKLDASPQDKNERGLVKVDQALTDSEPLTPASGPSSHLEE